MTNSNELKNLVEKTVLETYIKAQTLFKRSFELPTIEYRNLGSKGGMAYLYQNRIELNEVFLNHYGERFMQTVVHEISHLICKSMYPCAKSHGREFHNIMTALYGTSSRCHSYDITLNKKRKYHVYTCKCNRDIPLTSIIHNRIIKGSKRFCTVCKANIWLKEETNS